MENRITSLLLPIFLIAIAFVFFTQMNKKSEPANGSVNVPAQGGASDANIDPDDLFRIVSEGAKEDEQTFVIGDPGPRAHEGEDPGYRIETSSIGATIRSVDALDYYTEPGLSDEEKVKHQLPLIQDLNPGLCSFAIQDFTKRFPLKQETAGQGNRIDQVYWEPTDKFGEKGKQFRLELESAKKQRLIFEKDFVFLQGQRHMKLVIRIKNPAGPNAFDTSVIKTFRYYLRGPMTMRLDKDGPSFSTKPRAFAAAVKSDGEQRVAQLGSTGKRESPFEMRQLLALEGGERFHFAGAGNRFFVCVIEPDNDATAVAVSGVKAINAPFYGRATPEQLEDAYKTICPFLQISQTLPAAGEESELTFRIYIGPKDRHLFESKPEYDGYLAVSDLDLDPVCFCAFGAVTLAKILLAVLETFESFLGNWGLSIILLTLLVRAMMMPLNLRQARTMRAYQDKMTRLKPEMDAIREKYKNNKQKLNQAMLEFQKKHKVFPPLLGCLPMFLTLPVFLGLFTMLRASFPLRHQPFVGWIADLSQPDRLFELGWSWLPYLNLLPLLMLTLWMVNAFRSPLSEDSQQRQQQQMMRWMPMIFGVMLYGYASGLALYLTVSAVWSLIEQSIVRKKMGAVAGLPTTF